MCELFEQGIIHELWIAAEAGSHNVYENQSRMQVYTDDLLPVPGQFERCTNGCYHDPQGSVDCSVSVRIQEINKTRGPGCGTHASGHTFENLISRGVNPYLVENATRFLGFDLTSRYGIENSDAEASLYSCSYDFGECLIRDSASELRSGVEWGGEPFSIDDWGAGCGNVHFSPNSTTHYDNYSTVPASATCEGYGLGQGVGGADEVSVYEYSLAEPYDTDFGDCSGGWVVYWGQSFPGFENNATDADGAPMLNWWPFWFY